MCNGMGDGYGLVRLLDGCLGNALQEGLQGKVEILDVIFEKAKAGVFFKEQVVEHGRCQFGRFGIAAKPNPYLTGASHGMQFVCQLHGSATLFHSRFLQDL